MSWVKAIEELLQEIAQQQGAAPPPPQQPARPTARRPAPARAPEPVVEAQVLPDEDVATHVSQHVSTADIVQHTAELGAEVGLADEKLESHLQERFDHRVASIDSRAGVAARGGVSAQATGKGERRVAMASELAQMLRNPRNIRQAILLNEIFRRPEDRG
jgi:hypothetical protein